MAKGTLRVRVVGDASHLKRTLSSAGGMLGGFAKNAVKFGAVAAGAVAVGSVKAFADFDQAMTNSTAIMDDVTEKMRGDMSNAAREVAKTTTFSAKEAAESYFFLASAGLDAEESISALPKVASFAQAGNFDMARATDLATDAQSALGMTSEDTAENIENLSRTQDVFVKANTLANASVEQFATSMTRKAGAALQAVGKDIEEGTAALAVFADQGIKGEQAGTMLRTTLSGMSRGARENTEAFEDFGVSVFDADGEMRNMADIVADMETAFGDLSTEQQEAAIAQLGFTEEQRDGILALLGNSEALRDYEKELRNAGGTTQEVADKQLDSFWEQLGLLKDQIVDVGLSIGEALMPHLEAFVQFAQDNIVPAIERVVDAFSEEGLSGAVDEIGKIWDDVWPELQPILADLLESFASWVSDTAVPWIGDKAEELLDAFFEWATDPDVHEQLGDVITAVVDWIGDDLIPAVAEAAPGVGEALWEGFDESLAGGHEGRQESIKEFWGPVIADLVSGLDERWGRVEAAFDRKISALQTVWENRRSILLTVGEEMAGRVAEGIGAAMGRGVRAARNLADGIQRVIVLVPAALFLIGREMVAQLSGGVDSRLDQARNAAVNIKNAIMFAFRNPLEMLSTVGRQIISGLASAMVGAVGMILSSMSQVAAVIKTSIPNALTLLLTTGRQIIQGLINGIGSMIDNVVSAVGGVVARAAQAAREAAGIESPSKVFAGIGGDLVEGLVIGVRENAPDVVDEAKRMADDIISSGEDLIGRYSTATSELIDLFGRTSAAVALYRVDTIEDLESIAKAAKDMASDVDSAVSGFLDPLDIADDASGPLAFFDRLVGKTADVETWSRDIERLAEEGLSEGLLKKLIDAGPEGAENAAMLAEQIGTPLFEKINDAFDESERIVGDTIDKFGDFALPAFESGAEIGEGVGDGIVDGILETSPHVRDAITRMVNDGISAAEEELGIESPSKVFAKVGADGAEGLARGLAAGRGLVSAASADLAGMAQAGARSQLAAAGRSRGTSAAGGDNALVLAKIERHLAALRADAEERRDVSLVTALDRVEALHG